MKKLILFVTLLFLINPIALSQGKPDSLHKKKCTFILATGAGVASSLLILDQLWYANYRSATFHFFDDSREWLQLDKCGHALTCYQFSVKGIQAFQQNGYSAKAAYWWGGTAGIIYMSAIETLDGFSKGWGFSVTDMGANIFGSAVAMLQEYYFKQQLFELKFSFHTTPYAQYRPGLLGEKKYQQVIKDYNGQTYWLAVHVGELLHLKFGLFHLLNLSLGYGAEGMLSASENSYTVVDNEGNTLGNKSQRKYLLSLDINFNKIPVKNKLVKKIFNTINFIKIPFPTLEFSGKELKFHPLYF